MGLCEMQVTWFHDLGTAILEIETRALGELYDLLSALLNTNAGLAASIRLQRQDACSLESVPCPAGWQDLP